MAYIETHTEASAKELVIEIIEEELDYFSGETAGQSKAKEAITAKIDSLTIEMEALDDYDSKIYYAEKIDALVAAIDALEFGN